MTRLFSEVVPASHLEAGLILVGLLVVLAFLLYLNRDRSARREDRSARSFYSGRWFR